MPECGRYRIGKGPCPCGKGAADPWLLSGLGLVILLLAGDCAGAGAVNLSACAWACRR
jgi:hypothetical protein